MWSETEINADTMAYYLLENPQFDPQAGEFSCRALHWSEAKFANREWQEFGVLPINEQTTYKQPGNSHSTRHASLELLYGEKTGDHNREAAAIRRLNMVDENGRNMYPAVTRANASRPRRRRGALADRRLWRLWASLLEGDGEPAVAGAREPEPPVANDVGHPQHQLNRRRDSLREVRWRVHRLKLGEWAPHTVTGGKMQWDPKAKVLTVQSRPILSSLAGSDFTSGLVSRPDGSRTACCRAA